VLIADFSTEQPRPELVILAIARPPVHEGIDVAGVVGFKLRLEPEGRCRLKAG
jgi:hypothetical protein